MTDISFYHLTRQPLPLALPLLLQKALQSGARVLVRAASAERVEQLDEALWTFDPASFLPHGTDRNAHADLQPILLTTRQAPPANGASILATVDSVFPADADAFARVLYLFDGVNGDELAAARAAWTQLKAAGHSLTYWQQAERGWEKKASA
jgi:DNA polymerase III subunit chi